MVLMLLVILPSQAIADVTFEEEVAKAVYAELQTCRETNERVDDLINKYSLEDSADQLYIDNLSSRISLLENQIDLEHERAEKYRTEWKECGEALLNCQQSKPSRMKWFGFGFGGGIGTALLLLLL